MSLTTGDNVREVLDESFIVSFEGADKTGKSTTIERLSREFPSATVTTEPFELDTIDTSVGNWPTDEPQWSGRLVRELLRKEKETSPLGMFHAFLMDHYKHVEEVVLPTLRGERGVPMVICDRYIDSRYAYQTLNLRDEIPGDDDDVLDWILTVQEFPVQHSVVEPDLTIYLEISMEEFARRAAADDEEPEMYEGDSFQRELRGAYDRICERKDRMVRVDGEQTPEDVQQECIELIRAHAPDNLLGSLEQ